MTFPEISEFSAHIPGGTGVAGDADFAGGAGDYSYSTYL